MSNSGNIQINPETMTSVQAKFDRTLGNTFQVDVSTWIDDSSTHPLELTCETILQSTESLAETIVNFNDYLDSIANEFKEKDNKLASVISNVTIKTIPSTKQQAAQKKQKAKTSTTYKILP
ncbi:hypothetical protein D8808_00390 [Streptococcus gordonii]|uniref:hypothetical protein n=1 Tax=Streptococcus gordonii TaxID=1302 RepID=UPI000F67031B|nr:hypothetical protein [Streptococcus gordonii]RSJ58039.1 hypothetical protein D8808_00390 [Streptococcus gordonii]